MPSKKHITRLSSPKFFLWLILVLFSASSVSAQLKDCSAKLSHDTLTIENSLIRRRFLWNNGGLIQLDLLNKTTNQLTAATNLLDVPDFSIPGETLNATNGTFCTYIVPETAATPTYLAAEVRTVYGFIEYKRIYRIYPNCPAIACDLFLRGTPNGWKDAFKVESTIPRLEDVANNKKIDSPFFVTDKIGITGNQWNIKTVEFFDATDQNNNLVQTYQRLIYRKEQRLRGNILLAQNFKKTQGFFMLKESPVSFVQLYYQGADFTTKYGEVNAVGIGISPKDLTDTNWVHGYGVVVGVGNGNSEEDLLIGLRKYQQLQRKTIPQRDEMIISNTWGDRSQDSRVNETFMLKEIDAAARLGITHVQIDDGWQVGKSSNSKAGGGSLENIWKNADYWKPDIKKFPSGFKKIIDEARQKHIVISLWFNPSSDSSYANWEKDAEALLYLNKEYGIGMWKIDGVVIANKTAEINFRKMLDKVMIETNYQAVFNLDVTAGRRCGYHSFTKYGNLFLENRYTDWGNYYPYSTLRNLWQLSRYVAPQRFQVEFLNKWRNTSQYPTDDSLAPQYYSFDNLFAITMVAQPLAWFEASGLPQDAFKLTSLIAKYKTLNHSLHQGMIFPIGNEPDGNTWTGFQSIKNKEGYFLVFREGNLSANQLMATWLPIGTKVKLTNLLNSKETYIAIVDDKHQLPFSIRDRNDFGLLSYKIVGEK